MAKLNCPQLSRVIDIDPNLSVMANLLKFQIPVASSCGGDGICGKCRIRITALGPIPPASELERKTLERNKIPVGERLSCQLHIDCNAMVETGYW